MVCLNLDLPDLSGGQSQEANYTYYQSTIKFFEFFKAEIDINNIIFYTERSFDLTKTEVC